MYMTKKKIKKKNDERNDIDLIRKILHAISV